MKEVTEVKRKGIPGKKIILAQMITVVLLASLVGCTSKNDEVSASAETKADQTEAVSKEETLAESWKPDRDFTIRVPFAAGGVFDSVVRIVGQGLQSSYGKSVVVKNITGANGTIAANDLLNAPAEGTELMGGGIAMFTLAPLFNKGVSLNIEDYTIVSGLISEDFILFVNPAVSGIKTWEDFMTYGKSKNMIFGSNTPGGATNMLAVAVLGEAGLKGEALTSDGSNKDLLALLSGNVDFAIATTSLGSQYVGEENGLIPILVFSDNEYTGYDGYTVPTAKSKGYDIVFRSSNFLMTKSGVDREAVNSIYDTIQEYYKTDEFKELAEKINFIPDTSDGAEVHNNIEEAVTFCRKIYDKYYKQ